MTAVLISIVMNAMECILCNDLNVICIALITQISIHFQFIAVAAENSDGTAQNIC